MRAALRATVARRDLRTPARAAAARSSVPSPLQHLHAEMVGDLRAAAAEPGATTSRASRSVSTMATPSAANRLATVLLPQAMPPVSPMRKPPRMDQPWREQAEIALDHLVADDQRDPAGDGEERAEGDLRVPALALADHDHDAEHRAHAGGEHDDGQQHLPAQPGAERGEQLEVAVAHAFLAGEQLEHPVHAPQAQVTRGRADDAVARADGRARLRPRPDATG